MKPILVTLRVLCVGAGFTAVALDSGTDLGRRAILLGICVGFINWLLESKAYGWVDKMVALVGLSAFRKAYSLAVLVDLALFYYLTMNQHVESPFEAMWLYAVTVPLSGIALSSFLIFLRLKAMERAARS
ncbi:MAG: hypothetical protein HZC36_04845 [Armatimonadetes bacterium]|nr:hypothetical protein [Armatimonadota bacterium]